jgi:hypothetical protein
MYIELFIFHNDQINIKNVYRLNKIIKPQKLNRYCVFFAIYQLKNTYLTTNYVVN